MIFLRHPVQEFSVLCRSKLRKKAAEAVPVLAVFELASIIKKILSIRDHEGLVPCLKGGDLRGFCFYRCCFKAFRLSVEGVQPGHVPLAGGKNWDVPFCPIYHDVCLYATRKDVQDLKLDPSFKPSLDKAWIGE